MPIRSGNPHLLGESSQVSLRFYGVPTYSNACRHNGSAYCLNSDYKRGAKTNWLITRDTSIIFLTTGTIHPRHSAKDYVTQFDEFLVRCSTNGTKSSTQIFSRFRATLRKPMNRIVGSRSYQTWEGLCVSPRSRFC